jgi:three-Cys-motif partner protein
MLYIDGFAGPGRYADGEDGSPIVAVKAANDARVAANRPWKAKTIRMIFVERDEARFDILQSQIAACPQRPDVKVQCINDEFASAFSNIKREHRDAFTSSMPLFAFLDPFGVKGIPFQILKEILSSGTSEAFLLLDTDGMERIRSAGSNAGYEKVLDEVFGGSKWRDISFTDDAKLNSRKILLAYRRQLRSAAGAEFTFPFEMRKSNGTVSHHLLFATKHIRGLEKMKEAMRSVEKTFVFMDGQSNQPFLFDPDDPAVIRRDVEEYFQQQCSGRERSYDDIKSWVLQETHYTHADKILNKMRDRHGIESIVIGGKVVTSLPSHIQWADADRIKFRDRLAPPVTGLFGQE